MSKDIRSWFKAVKPKNMPEKKELSDDDVIPESPDVQITSKKKQSRKKRVLQDSSDEEIFTTPKKPKTKSPTPSKDKRKPDKEKKSMKEVKAVDMFGSGPIKRTEPIVKTEKKLKTEIGIHDDDDFEKSLLEIDDNIDAGVVNVNTNNKSHAEITEEIVEKESAHLNGEASKCKRDVSKIKSPIKPISSALEEKNRKNVEENGLTTSGAKTNTKDFVNKSKMKSTANYSSQSKTNEKIDKTKHSTSTEETPKTKEPLKLKSEETITIADDESETEEKCTIAKSYKIPKIKTDLSNATTDNKSKSDRKSPKKKSHSTRDDKEAKKPESSGKSKLESKLEKSDNKRDFSEFINGDEGFKETQKEENDTKNKKKKLDTSLNSSVLTDEERHERKRHSAALYQSYLNRSGPKNLGAKEIPEGMPDCLKDCAFLLTGVLDSFERDEVADAIKKYGGTVKSGISRKVTHVLAGDDAGPAKVAKAEELGIPVINEDQFLTLITDRSKPAKGSKESSNIKDKDAPKRKHKDNCQSKEKEKEKQSRSSERSKEKSAKVSEDKMKSFEEKIKKNFYAKPKEVPLKIESSPERDSQGSENDRVATLKSQKTEVNGRYDMSSSSSVAGMKSESSSNASVAGAAGDSLMWVDKYKPLSVKHIIGQHGESSNVKKLMNWLTKWYLNRREKIPKPSPWAKNDDGAYYKAALLSGPPGVGKTTTVALVCKELGFDTVEFNASDTRSKSLIKEQIGELLTTTSLSGFARGNTGKSAVTKKHVLVMDEVDGMAGNEDRGGLQELISLIKTTGVPIVCMCNDRNSEKMRTLVNYCYDLKFSKPRVDQIKSAMLSICFKEKLKLPPDALAQLIVSCSQDVRQTLNSLSMYAVNPANMTQDNTRAKKDIKLGPWEVIRKVFSAEEHKTMSLNDKSDLFFYDYSIAPLFVQENYLSVAPHCNKNEILDRMSQAADSISLGDIVEARIRRSQAWNLLPIQAMYSSVIPGTVLSGHVAGQIQFPGWLGKNSRANKMHRLAQEIHAHTRLSATGSKSSIFLDYARHLRDAIVLPLVKLKADGINDAIEVLTAYHLPREDLDSLTELANWPGQRDPMILVDSKVKAAMTRTYNKQAPALPHTAASFTKSRRQKEDGRESETEDEAPSDAEGDSMIKVKKQTKKKEPEKDADKPSSSKGKKGKGKK